MSFGEKCEGTFKDYHLQRALDLKVYLRYQEALANDAIKQVNLQNLVTCPACGFKAELDEGIKWFKCPNCKKESCRECGEDKHPGQYCEEVRDPLAAMKVSCG